MKILHEEKDGRGRHYIKNGAGDTVAEITYSVGSGSLLTVDHTGVDADLQGKNIGQDLVHAVVEQARAEGKKIVPQCTFAKAVIERAPEYQDVVA